MAIDLITQHIRMKLQQPDLRRIYHNLEVIPSNYQIKGMHTIVRDRETNKTDFVFYSDRLLRLVSIVAGSFWRRRGVLPSTACTKAAHLCLSGRQARSAGEPYLQRSCLQVVEAGLGHLPFAERTVITPTGHQYVGVDFAKRLCGVSVIRSGESMENALRACCKGIKIGKILVHR